MKPQLQLRIRKFLDGESLDNGAIVEVRSLALKGSAPVLHRVPVPVSDDASQHRTVDVKPGRYEVSAMLPSGSVVSRVVTVSEKDERVDAALDAGSSPHEWLSWQQWSGNIAQSFASERPLDFAPPVEPSEIAAFRVPTQGTAPREPVWDALAAQLGMLEGPRSIDAGSLMPAHASLLPPDVLKDPPYVAVRLPRNVPSHAERAWLVITMNDQTMLCAMPWPWQQSDHSGEALVEAVVSGDAGAGTWSVRTTVRDHVIAGLLSYFASGEQRVARELMEPARDLLFGKKVNPLAAAAGAYILVGQWIDDSARGTSQQDWMQWVRNLSDWFPWIPDGAILKGWLALRLRGRSPDLDEARAALLEAERRGIPVYAAGVRRLVDGLMLLAGELRRTDRKDPEVDAALARVRRLAWQIDPTQPFTCIRLWA